MDPSSADYIRHRIARFRAAVDQTRRHPDALSPFDDTLYAAAPYYENAGIPDLLANIPRDHPERGIICAGYDAALADLRALETELGESWRDLLRSDLHRYIDAYAAAVSHASYGAGDLSGYCHVLRGVIGSILDGPLAGEGMNDAACLVSVLDRQAASAGAHGGEFTPPDPSSGVPPTVPAGRDQVLPDDLSTGLQSAGHGPAIRPGSPRA